AVFTGSWHVDSATKHQWTVAHRNFRFQRRGVWSGGYGMRTGTRRPHCGITRPTSFRPRRCSSRTTGRDWHVLRHQLLPRHLAIGHDRHGAHTICRGRGYLDWLDALFERLGLAHEPPPGGDDASITRTEVLGGAVGNRTALVLLNGHVLDANTTDAGVGNRLLGFAIDQVVVPLVLQRVIVGVHVDERT